MNISVAVCGVNIRQRSEGECEAEAVLKIAAADSETVTVKYLTEAEEGEKVDSNDCALSVYIPTAGDGLWELAKSLNKSPEEVSASNPDIEFPVREGQRVIVFRRKTLNA